MKKLAIITALILAPVLSFGQGVFDKFEDNEEVFEKTRLVIDGIMTVLKFAMNTSLWHYLRRLRHLLRLFT